jgi:hypothetical protein
MGDPMKKLIFVFFAILLAACSSTSVKLNEGGFRDATITVPAQQFEDNETARSVLVGSAQLAKDSNCTFMQRYKITTNQNFTSTVNLFKYRAALMGAERVAFIKHEELDAKEEKFAKSDLLYVKDGTTLNGADYQTTLIGDLYDCTCPNCACAEEKPGKPAPAVCSPKK